MILRGMPEPVSSLPGRIPWKLFYKFSRCFMAKCVRPPPSSATIDKISFFFCSPYQLYGSKRVHRRWNILRLRKVEWRAIWRHRLPTRLHTYTNSAYLWIIVPGGQMGRPEASNDPGHTISLKLLSLRIGSRSGRFDCKRYCHRYILTSIEMHL